MATSYANPGGTGDRTSIITVTTTATLAGGSPPISGLVDGINSNTGAPFWTAGQTLRTITFDFGPTLFKQVIDEAKWYQNGTSAHGTWRWEASDDGSSWTPISANFTLDGGSTGAVIGDLSANTTGYRYYRLAQQSGTTSATPWLREIEFKIEQGDPLAGDGGGLGDQNPIVNVFF